MRREEWYTKSLCVLFDRVLNVIVDQLVGHEDFSVTVCFALLKTF